MMGVSIVFLNGDSFRGGGGRGVDQ